MFVIGLTGGIAAGKSLVAARLRELGAVHIDADALAREVVEPGSPALAQIAERFGGSVLTPEGALDRPALGAIVFRDPQALAELNEITHPAVWLRARDLIAAAEAADPHAVIVYDVPLLVEAAGARPLKFDLIVVVHASAEERIRRMVEVRGMTRDEALQRISAQASDDERLAIADVVISNEGPVADTLAQVDDVWRHASAAASAT